MNAPFVDEKTTKRPKFPIQMYISEGNMYFRRRKYDTAIQFFNSALEMEPINEKALVGRSKCHMQLGKLREAKEDALAALETNPNSCDAQMLIGKVEYFLGDFEKAFITFSEGHNARPNHEGLKFGHQMCRRAIDNALQPETPITLDDQDLANISKVGDDLNKRETTETPIGKDPYTKDVEFVNSLLKDESMTRVHPECEFLKGYLRDSQEFWKTQNTETAKGKRKEMWQKDELQASEEMTKDEMAKKDLIQASKGKIEHELKQQDGLQDPKEDQIMTAIYRLITGKLQDPEETTGEEMVINGGIKDSKRTVEENPEQQDETHDPEETTSEKMVKGHGITAANGTMKEKLEQQDEKQPSEETTGEDIVINDRIKGSQETIEENLRQQDRLQDQKETTGGEMIKDDGIKASKRKIKGTLEQQEELQNSEETTGGEMVKDERIITGLDRFITDESQNTEKTTGEEMVKEDEIKAENGTMKEKIEQQDEKQPSKETTGEDIVINDRIKGSQETIEKNLRQQDRLQDPKETTGGEMIKDDGIKASKIKIKGTLEHQEELQNSEEMTSGEIENDQDIFQYITGESQDKGETTGGEMVKEDRIQASGGITGGEMELEEEFQDPEETTGEEKLKENGINDSEETTEKKL